MTDGVAISRTSLSLPDLTIAASATGSPTYLLTENGLGRPAITARETRVPDHSDMHGSVLLSSVKEQSSLPLEVLVQATSAAALDTAVQDLADALWQFTYTATVTVGGVAKVWACDPANYAAASGVESSPMWAQFFDVLAITIPVYPIPGSVT